MKPYLSPYLILFISLVSFQTSFSQSGVIRESLSEDSQILGRSVAFSVYLPAGYDVSNRSYPVLYLLHGFTDDETAWTQFGEVKAIADRAMQRVEVTPMIIVMPDAGVSWYINSRDESVRYEDFFVDEFIPAVEERFRIRSEKEFRAVAGLSMGGYGAMIYGLKHPGLFSAVAPLSAAVSKDEALVEMPVDRWNEVYGVPFGRDLKEEERLSSHYRNYSVLDLVKNGSTEEMKRVRYYIDCGDDDFLIKGNMALHAALLDKEVPHEFRVRDGGHTWSYWRSALPEVLRFVSAGFHR